MCFIRKVACGRALKEDFELTGTIREGMKPFWSGVSGAGLWAQKEAVLPKGSQR